MSNLPIRIMTRDFNLLGETSRYESLQITRSWHGLGVLEMWINRYRQHADKFLKGNIIFPHNQLNKAYIIRHREIELDEKGKASENWIIRASPLKSYLSQRITIPIEGEEYDKIEGDAETVMKHYVNNHLVNPLDSKRKIPNLVIAPSQNRGIETSWQSRYKNVAEEMETISLSIGLGWDIYLDIGNKQFVFDVYEGENLSANQSILPPVIFSPQLKSLKQLSYTESDLDYKNYAIVAGQGEGVDRRIIEAGEESSGYERYELFVDARDVNEEEHPEEGEPYPRPEQDIISDLTSRGNQKLSEHSQEVYLEGQILTKSPFVYQEDYDLGDIVTVQNKDWGVTMDSRITEVKEIYEASGFQLDVVFDNDKPNLTDKVKRGFNEFKNEVTR